MDQSRTDTWPSVLLHLAGTLSRFAVRIARLLLRPADDRAGIAAAKGVALAVALAALAVPLLLVANAAERPAGRPALARPTPEPTACQVVYIADDGMESCLALPSFGMEPYP